MARTKKGDSRSRDGEDAADNVEVSRPLDVRKFQGNARCTRCRENNRDCYLERKQGDLRCLTCLTTDECRFRRVVVREAAAVTFTWDELIGDGSNDNPPPPVASPRKRARTDVPTFDLPHTQTVYSTVPPNQYIPSTYSEPPSQIRSNVEFSPYNSRKPYLSEELLISSYGAPTVPQFSAQPFPQNLDQIGALVNLPRWFGDPHMDWDPTELGHLPPPPADVQMAANDSVVQATSQPVEVYPPPVQIDIKPPIHNTYNARVPIQKSVSNYGDGQTKFHCEDCNEDFNTKSELSKHHARHAKKWVCDNPGCPRRSEGFATKNDLDRHKASVHRDNTVARREYKCVVAGCKDPNKMWDRKDNFKAHVKRMHPDADVEDVVARSFQGDVEPRKSQTPDKRSSPPRNDNGANINNGQSTPLSPTPQAPSSNTPRIFRGAYDPNWSQKRALAATRNTEHH